MVAAQRKEGKLMHCPRYVFNQGQHIKGCTAPKGGLFNPQANVYQQFFGPGGARDRMRAIRKAESTNIETQ